MWFCRSYNNLPSQVEKAQNRREKVCRFSRGVNQVMGEGGLEQGGEEGPDMVEGRRQGDRGLRVGGEDASEGHLPAGGGPDQERSQESTK